MLTWGLLALSFAQVFAQNTPPSEFAYQAVIRQADGRLNKNMPVTLIVSLRPGQGGATVWQESKTSITDAFGVVALKIGSGPNQISGYANFSDVPLGAGSYWLRIRLNNSTGPVIADQQLLSVPYATYARYSGSANPPGSVMAFAGDTNKIPTGWLLCNGRQFNINDVDTKSGLPVMALYNAIGTAWGTTGTGFFNVPDMRGVFLRGVDAGVGQDSARAARTAIRNGGNTGDAVGSYQGDALRNHQHISGFGAGNEIGRYGNIAGLVEARRDIMENGGYDDRGAKTSQPIVSNPLYISAETRPKNVYVNYIIKL